MTFTQNCWDVVQHHTQGNEHRIVTRNHVATLEQLRAHGAQNLEITRLPLEDIVVHILRESAPAMDAKPFQQALAVPLGGMA